MLENGGGGDGGGGGGVSWCQCWRPVLEQKKLPPLAKKTATSLLKSKRCTAAAIA